MPPEATEIRIAKIPNGFRAKFTIDESDVSKWNADIWAKYGELDENKGRGEPVERPGVDTEMRLQFDGLNWELPDADVAYAGPVAPNGATFVIWYNRASKSATHWGCYW